MGNRGVFGAVAAFACCAALACGGSAPLAAGTAPRADAARGEGGAAEAASDALRVPIFMYHHIGAADGKKWRPLYVSLPQFSRQMAALAASGAASLTLDDLYRAVREGRTFPRGAYALTFDDGTSDQFLLAYPILRRHGIKATFYLSPSLIGRRGYITWAQAREMQRSGLVLFAAHTLTHASLTTIGDDEARREIVESRAEMERRLGVPIRHFAYPYGHFDDAVLGMVRRAGYLTAVTTKYAWGHASLGALRWGRLTVHDTNAPANLASLARSSGSRVPATQ